MSAGMIAQHAVAIGAALGAAGWLFARTRSPKSKLEGPCASCAAASHRRAAKRPDESRSRPIALKN